MKWDGMDGDYLATLQYVQYVDDVGFAGQSNILWGR